MSSSEAKDKKNNKSNERNKNLEFIYDTVNRRVYYEYDVIDKKDQKASTIIGFNAIILSIIFASFQKVTFCPSLFYTGVTLIFGALVFALIGYRIAEYSIAPEPKEFYIKYKEEPYSETIENLTSTLAEVYERNKRRIQDKGIYINWSLIYSIIGIGILLLSVVISC